MRLVFSDGIFSAAVSAWRVTSAWIPKRVIASPYRLRNNGLSTSRPRMRGWSSAIVFFQSGQKRTFRPFPRILTEPVPVESQVRSSIMTRAASVGGFAWWCPSFASCIPTPRRARGHSSSFPLVARGILAGVEILSRGQRYFNTATWPLLYTTVNSNLAAFPDAFRRHHQDQHTPRPQPTVGVRQKNTFRAFVSTFSVGPWVGARVASQHCPILRPGHVQSYW
jgi:hypothetical protein